MMTFRELFVGSSGWGFGNGQACETNINELLLCAKHGQATFPALVNVTNMHVGI